VRADRHQLILFPWMLYNLQHTSYTSTHTHPHIHTHIHTYTHMHIHMHTYTQEYNAKKRAEHTFKSFTADSTKISAVDPDFYAERFLNWMESHVA
jgi:hypothetical protein